MGSSGQLLPELWKTLHFLPDILSEVQSVGFRALEGKALLIAF